MGKKYREKKNNKVVSVTWTNGKEQWKKYRCKIYRRKNCEKNTKRNIYKICKLKEIWEEFRKEIQDGKQKEKQ